MTLESLISDLNNIVKVHPELLEATIWASVQEEEDCYGNHRLRFVRIDNKHKPIRIIFDS